MGNVWISGERYLGGADLGGQQLAQRRGLLRALVVLGEMPRSPMGHSAAMSHSSGLQGQHDLQGLCDTGPPSNPSATS